MFLWIRLTLTALSRAENAAWISLGALETLAFLSNDLKPASLFLFLAVLNLSFRTFLIADFMIGMGGMVSQPLFLRKQEC